jgi:hypothetical protein
MPLILGIRPFVRLHCGGDGGHDIGERQKGLSTATISGGCDLVGPMRELAAKGATEGVGEDESSHPTQAN